MDNNSQSMRYYLIQWKNNVNGGRLDDFLELVIESIDPNRVLELLASGRGCKHTREELTKLGFDNWHTKKYTKRAKLFLKSYKIYCETNNMLWS